VINAAPIAIARPVSTMFRPRWLGSGGFLPWPISRAVRSSGV